MAMFKNKKKKEKAKPVAPPIEAEDEVIDEDELEEVDDGDVIEEDEIEDEVEEIEEKTKAIKKKIAKVKKEQPAEEELTEDKVKQILMDHQTRLQKIEYNLRLVP